MPGLNSENSTSRFQESMRSSDDYSSSEDNIPEDESCCEGQLRDSAFYTDEKIEDAMNHILSQAMQQFSKATRSSAAPGELDHFKCPFYASNPEGYRHCLARCDLRSVESVIMHMKRHHKKPPSCPMCSKTFETVAECDKHIMKRKCETGPLEVPDGINHYQKSQLRNKTKSKDYTDLGPEQRWEYIYKLVFPESQSYPSATMDTEGEKRVLQARVFWHAQGRKYVTEYCQTGSGFEIEDVQEVYKACLHALVERVVDKRLMF